MVIADAAVLKGRDPVDACRRAVRGGATLVQIRMKGAPPRDVLALAVGAAGAHLGQDDPPLDALRPHVPPDFILGLSVGSQEEADRVTAWPAGYWSVGPCFATTTKSDAGAPLGPPGFAALASRAPNGIPVIGIGGITAANAAAIVAAGAAGVAVTAAVFGASDPEAAARALRSACDAPPRSPPGGRGR